MIDFQNPMWSMESEKEKPCEKLNEDLRVTPPQGGQFGRISKFTIGRGFMGVKAGDR
jgi:hypothetical protein